MKTADTAGTPVTMIDRVASLLQAFDGRPRLTLAQIAHDTQLPRSSVHRILQRLVELGWVERQGNQYALGIRMFELGAQVVRRDRVHQASLPFMHTLHRSTGLTVHLSALVASDVLHLERIGDWPHRQKAWQLGARQPAVHAAAGRALLARLAEADWPQLVFPSPAVADGVRTPDQLRQELNRVRDRGGVALDDQGCAVGVTAVAAPIGPSESSLRMAISLCGPTGTLSIRGAEDAVRIAARDIWYAATGMAKSNNRIPRACSDHPVRASAPVLVRD